MRFLAGAAAAAVLALGLTGCSAAVDQREVEQKLAEQLTAQVGQAPESVTCPGDLDAEVGRQMRCRIRATDGSTIGVGLRVTSVQGTDVEWDFAVDDTVEPAAP